MNKVCFALDFASVAQAVDFIDHRQFHSELAAVKVGLEVFIAGGTRAVRPFIDQFHLPVVLDLKLHDIPETVERAVKAGGDLGVQFMTLHIQQRATLERAVKAAEPYGIQLLGVTVLTSMEEEDCHDLGHVVTEDGITGRVLDLAVYGMSCGLTGFVCSPKDVSLLRKISPGSFILVPGVRPAGASLGDQRRVGTPGQAVADGASLVVVGRPIRDAADPLQALQDINREISTFR